MHVLGISVDPNGGNPRLRCVVLSGDQSHPLLISEFDISTAATDSAVQSVDLAKLLLGRLPGLAINQAVIRKAGPASHPNRRQAQFSRAHTEGAVLYVLSEHLGTGVSVGDPQSLATSAGMKKTELVSRGTAVSKKRCDAALAGLSLLPPP